VKSLRARLTPKTNAEAGLTLIEVIIAMMIFAVVAAGVAFVLVSSLSTTRDARAREVATNLAARDIDLARAASDVTTVVDAVTTTTVSGITYTLTRKTGWISSTGADSTCGSAGGVLMYKHVNDRVTWTGARTSKTQVQADTLIAPSGRLNDPALGTILVSVLGATGTGVSGVTVNAAPTATNAAGAAALSTSPLATDVQGCSYILKVAPGNYLVSVSKSGGYVSNALVATPSQTVAVVAGDSSVANFQYDVGANFTVDYASNSAAANIQFPTNLDVNFVSANATFSPTVTVPASTILTTTLFPFSSGYSIFTGKYVPSSSSSSQTSCLSPDPANWPANAAGVAGRRQLPATLGAGGAGTFPAPMGVVTVTSASGTYLTAVSATAAASVGDPGCAITTLTYKFSAKTTSTSTVLALPFGTWKLYSGSSVGSTSASNLIASSAIALPAGSPANTAAGVFTLDPRVIAP
jgi:prepilin-type N-terminal cleavage/methylation domain-containing protein